MTKSGSSPSGTALRSLGQALLENGGGGQTPLRQTPVLGRRATPLPQADLQGAVAARDSELALLRQQLAALTDDFKFNLRLLEERDLELGRLEAVLGGLRESAAAKELALAEAKRLLAERDTALREREARLSVLEERQRQTTDLCERQVADARASRDEEVAQCEAKCAALEQQLAQRMAAVEGIAAREKADIIAGYEKQISAAVAAEREARQAAAQARQDGELAASRLAHAEARVVEQELAMQRMVSQFEASLAALKQLEGQYSELAAESAAVEAAGSGRIQQLELELDAARAAQREQDGAVSGLSQQLAERERQLAEAKQRYHRASLDNADLTETISRLKQELQQARDQAQRAEGELQAAGDRCSQAQAALDREASAHAQTQGLLETARLYLETARRDGEAHAQETAQLREGVAVRDAQCLDAANALEAVQAKLRAGDERLRLVEAQLERERAGHAESLARQERQLVAEAERALAGVQEEKAALQEALEAANRQLQQAYRETETLRLQLDHMRLAPPPPASTTATAAALSPRQAPSRPQQPCTVGQGATTSWGSGGRPRSERYEAAAAQPASPRHGWAAGSSDSDGLIGAGRYNNAAHDEANEAASCASGDVFSDVGDGLDSARGLGPAPSRQHGASRFAPPPPSAAAAAGAASHYQQQLHRHIDALSTKLSSFEQAVEKARHAGSQAASEVVRSGEELPQPLQRRQAEVAEATLQRKLARERKGFLLERQRLDEELAGREWLLAEREQELARLAQEREVEVLRQKQAELREKEEELQRLAQRLQQQRQQAAALGATSVPASAAGSVPPSPPAAQALLQPQPQPQRAPAAPAISSSLPPSRPLPWPLGNPSLRGSGGHSATAVPAGAVAPPSSGGLTPTQAALQRLALGTGSLRQSAESLVTPRGGLVVAAAPQPPSTGQAVAAALGPRRSWGPSAQPSPAAVPAAASVPGPLAGKAGAGGGEEDPLARARCQVMLAKDYLRQVADLGGQLSRRGV